MARMNFELKVRKITIFVNCRNPNCKKKKPVKRRVPASMKNRTRYCCKECLLEAGKIKNKLRYNKELRRLSKPLSQIAQLPSVRG